MACMRGSPNTVLHHSDETPIVHPIDKSFAMFGSAHSPPHWQRSHNANVGLELNYSTQPEKTDMALRIFKPQKTIDRDLENIFRGNRCCVPDLYKGSQHCKRFVHGARSNA